jgi:hypothetical protein
MALEYSQPLLVMSLMEVGQRWMMALEKSTAQVEEDDAREWGAGITAAAMARIIVFSFIGTLQHPEPNFSD